MFKQKYLVFFVQQMEKVLLRFLEQLGTIKYNIDKHIKRKHDQQWASRSRIILLFGIENKTQIPLQTIQKYANKKGILPSKDQLENLYRVLNIRKQEHLSINSICDLLQLQNKEDDSQKEEDNCSYTVLDNLIQSLFRTIIAGYRQIRKLRRLILSYKDKKQIEWLSLIWSKQEGIVTMEQVDLFLSQSYVDKSIIQSLMKFFEEQEIEILNEQNFKKLIVPHSFPVGLDAKSNADIKIRRFAKDLQLKYEFKENKMQSKIQRIRTLKLWTQRRFDNLQKQAQMMKTERLQNVIRLKNKEQLKFYSKVNKVMEDKKISQFGSSVRSRTRRSFVSNESICL